MTGQQWGTRHFGCSSGAQLYMHLGAKNTEKDLGVLVDKKMKHSVQCQAAVSKASTVRGCT